MFSTSEILSRWDELSMEGHLLDISTSDVSLLRPIFKSFIINVLLRVSFALVRIFTKIVASGLHPKDNHREYRHCIQQRHNPHFGHGQSTPNHSLLLVTVLAVQLIPYYSTVERAEFPAAYEHFTQAERSRRDPSAKPCRGL